VIVIIDSGVLFTLISTSKVKEVTDCQDWFYYMNYENICYKPTP